MGDAPATDTVPAAPTVPAPTRSSTTPLRPVANSEEIDLLGTAGMPVLKRLAPLVGGALLFLVIWRLFIRPRG